MVSLSVDGLVSGLDTTSLVSQLVAAEALPQTRLKTQMSTAQAAAGAYRAVNTKIDAVRTDLERLFVTAGLVRASSGLAFFSKIMVFDKPRRDRAVSRQQG